MEEGGVVEPGLSEDAAGTEETAGTTVLWVSERFSLVDFLDLEERGDEEDDDEEDVFRIEDEDDEERDDELFALNTLFPILTLTLLLCFARVVWAWRVAATVRVLCVGVCCVC